MWKQSGILNLCSLHCPRDHQTSSQRTEAMLGSAQSPLVGLLNAPQGPWSNWLSERQRFPGERCSHLSACRWLEKESPDRVFIPPVSKRTHRVEKGRRREQRWQEGCKQRWDSPSVFIVAKQGLFFAYPLWFRVGIVKCCTINGISPLPSSSTL